MSYQIRHGDALSVLGEMPDNEFSGCLTDPPYGLSFMGKSWDRGVPDVEVWAEVLRVLKPGAFLLAFGGTRTYHRLTCAIEDAGFEIRDCCMWLYGSGFPKSLDVSKAIDKQAGAVREITQAGNTKAPELAGKFDQASSDQRERRDNPVTESAKRFSGYGTALKPAWEPIIVAMKPLDGTFAGNALRHGVAGVNIDAGRIPSGEDHKLKCESVVGLDSNRNGACFGEWSGVRESSYNDAGRWPANVLLDDVAAVALNEQGGDLGKSAGGGMNRDGKGEIFLHSNGHEKVKTVGFGDSGGASRFFYTAKASARDRGYENSHPCVKPTDLTRYLAKLILPPEGATRKLLVPFSGSGSEIVGADIAGWDHIVGIEMDEAYCELAKRRLNDRMPLFAEEVAV